MYGLNRYMIDINIETLAGTTFSLKVSPLESVQSVKAKIQRHEGIPISHQHLVWQSNELDDKCSLNDYNIPNGATIRMVLALRGGPINTRRMTTEDALIRDVSDLMEIHEDSNLWNNESSSHSNKHVTLLLFRDGDHLNLLRVIDRGDANSPISGAMSAASMYVPCDDAEHDAISVANNLEDILSSAALGSSTTELNSLKSSTRSKQIKLLSKRKKSSTNENLKTKEKMLVLKQKLKMKTNEEKIEEQEVKEESQKIENEQEEQKKKSIKLKKNSSQTNLKENYEPEYEPDEIDDDDEEFSDGEYADEYLEDDEYEDDDDDEDYEDDDEEEEDNQYYPNLSQTSENVNQLESEYTPEEDGGEPGDDDYDEDENELMLNKSEFLLNEDQQPTGSPNELLIVNGDQYSLNGATSSLATTALPTVNTPTDTENLQTPYSGRINKNGLLSSKLEYLKNRRKVDSKVLKTENEEENQDGSDEKIKKNRRRRKDDENEKPRRRRTKRYEITSFSPTTILVKTVSLDPERKKSIKKLRKPEIISQDEPLNRIVSSSQKRVSFSVNDDSKQVDDKMRPLILSKKPPTKLDALYTTSKSGIEETITSLPVKNNQLNPILKTSNRLEMLKTNLTNSASILKPYQPNPILAPILDKNNDRIFSANRQKQLSFSANDLSQPSKSTFKLPPVVTSSAQSSTEGSILIAGSTNNLNSIGINEVKKKVTDLSRYCYFCKKKTGLASSYMCRCGNNYCTQHRNAEAHSCTFDYKTEGRKLIEQSNPLVAAPKLPKI